MGQFIFNAEQFTHSFAYPAKFTEDKDDGGYVVTFRDLPEAVTQGETVEECIIEAKDCLDEALTGRIYYEEEIPEPSKRKKNDYIINPPVTTVAKAFLYLKVKEKKISKIDLAAMLGVDEKEVRRILDPYRMTKIPTMERALIILGIELKVVI